MISADQIRKVVAAYVSDNNSDKFVRDFSALSYNIHKSGNAEATSLARSVEFKMADFRSGCITKSAFLDELRILIGAPSAANRRVFGQFSDPVNRRVVIESDFQGWAAASGTSPAVGFGSILLVQS
jgi:hypothetical protein